MKSTYAQKNSESAMKSFIIVAYEHTQIVTCRIYMYLKC